MVTAGRAAHVLYRLDGEPVSLFVHPWHDAAGRGTRCSATSRWWTAGDRTYMLIAAPAGRNNLARVVALADEAK